MDYPGNLFVVAAPSGAGKSSLVKALLEVDSHLALSVSHTTRAPRGQEQDGREYRFVDEAAFRAMVERGEFLEWAQVHGHLYGTSRKAEIESRIRRRRGRGARNRLAGRAADQAVVPECGADLHPAARAGTSSRQRLTPPRRGPARGDRQRMANARVEVPQARHFDFVIINALFETALFDLKTDRPLAATEVRRAAQQTSLRSSPRSTSADASGDAYPEAPSWPASPSKIASSRFRTAFSWCWPPPTARAC